MNRISKLFFTTFFLVNLCQTGSAAAAAPAHPVDKKIVVQWPGHLRTEVDMPCLTQDRTINCRDCSCLTRAARLGGRAAGWLWSKAAGAVRYAADSKVATSVLALGGPVVAYIGHQMAQSAFRQNQTYRGYLCYALPALGCGAFLASCMRCCLRDDKPEAKRQ